MNKQHRSASIVLYVLMMLSIIVMLTQQLMRGVFVGSNFTRTMIDRERAEMLALSGIQIAMAQLTYEEKESKEQETTAQASEEGKLTGVNKFLARILPYMNRWQDFKIDEKTDGLDGLIRVCITCEHGKININEIFDFKKMEFKKEYEALLKGLELPGKIPAGEMFVRLTEFFKQRKRKLDDISELLAVPGFGALDIFYQPPSKQGKGKKSQPNTNLALQDIFTIWTEDEKIDLLWLSDALCAILGMRRPLADDAVTQKKRFAQFAQSFKKEMAHDWDNNWKILENIYDQKPKIFPEIKSLFTKGFGPNIFSVLSCGKVGQVDQYVLAVICVEEKAKEEGNEDILDEKKQDESSSVGENEKKFKILRMYWL